MLFDMFFFFFLFRKLWKLSKCMQEIGTFCVWVLDWVDYPGLDKG